jgi:hypothetical protein
VSITLTPSDYQCPEHHVDLTALARQQLEQEDIPVASYRGAYYVGVSRRRARERPFTVVVNCPGNDPEKPHDVECTGTFLEH